MAVECYTMQCRHASHLCLFIASFVGMLGSTTAVVARTPTLAAPLVQQTDDAKLKIAPRGPNGEIYPNRAVELWPVSTRLDDYKGYHWTGKTDSRGDAVATGLAPELTRERKSRVHVVLPQIGFADSSPFQLKDGKTVRATLPALTPLVKVSGIVSPSLRKPEMIVRLGRAEESFGDPAWAWRQADVDRQGRWTLPDVVPGTHVVYLFNTQEASDSPDVARDSVADAFFVVAGRRVQQKIVLNPRSKVLPAPVITPPTRPAVPLTTTVTGVVRNADGTPAVNVDVWALSPSQTMSLITHHFHAKTDTSGSYRIEGIINGGDAFSRISGLIKLYVTHAGSAPLIGGVYPEAAEVQAPVFQFAQKEAELAVTLLDSDDRPVTGATVYARSERFESFLDLGAVAQSDTDTQEILQAVVPKALTGSDGVAHFSHLHPDCYTLTTGYPLPNNLPHQPFLRIVSPVTNRAAVVRSVPVSVGAENRYVIRFAPHAPTVKLRFLLPDGTPVKGEVLRYETRLAAQERYPGYTTRYRKDDQKDGEAWIGAGVWHIAAYVSPGPPYQSPEEEPTLIGQTTIAASPYQANEAAVDVHMLPRSPVRWQVRLIDENGKPVQGTVYKSYDRWFGNAGPKALGTSTARGEVTLTDFVEQLHETITLCAEALQDAPLPYIPRQTNRFPLDAQLSNLRRWPTVSVPFEPGQNRKITLQAARVGWIRGKVLNTPDGYFDGFGEAGRRWGIEQHFNRQTGEYLMGPLAAGSYTFDFASKAGGKSLTAAVKPGLVTHLDFALDPTLAQKDEEAEQQHYDRVPVTVVDAVGKPVNGATLWFYDGKFILSRRLTNAAGEAQIAPIGRGRGPFSWPTPSSSAPSPTSPLSTPAWIAFLPGSYGISMVPVAIGATDSAPQRIMLPPALSLSGKITVGGKPLTEFPGDVIVHARNENGVPVASITAPVSADGTFRLQGLTPGRYTVQAMLDQTYFSRAQTLIVSADMAVPAWTINIETPGAPLSLTLGQAATLGHVTLVDKPTGPLADAYRPNFYAVDGAGIVHLEGLTAGMHTIQLPNGTIREINIAPEK